MNWRFGVALSVAAAVFAAAFGGGLGLAQQPAPEAPAGGGGRGGGAAAAGFFTAVDADKDGATTSAEMRATFERWFGQWDPRPARSARSSCRPG